MNPLGDVLLTIQSTVENILEKMGVKVEVKILRTPSSELGDFSFPAFTLSKNLKKDPNTIAMTIANEMSSFKIDFIKKINVVGGYVNFYLNRKLVTEKILKNVLTNAEKYGKSNVLNGLKIMVEHTSVNPIAPMHIGNLRNSCIGDVFANVLEMAGGNVKRHFYVDDMGKQSVATAIGYKLLKDRGVKPNRKPDLWMGIIYALMNAFLMVQEVKEKIWDLIPETKKYSKNKYYISDDELNLILKHKKIQKFKELKKEIIEWSSVLKSLEERFPELTKKLLKEVSKIDDLKNYCEKLGKRYEEGDPEVKIIIREMCNVTLNGIKETLSNFGIYFDSFDWESDLVWSGKVRDVLIALERSGYVYKEDGVKILDLERFVSEHGLKKKLGISESFEIPPLVLTRSDGTTLYTTRDIAYTVWKFEDGNFDRVYNVIGAEQSLPQLQINIALRVLGHDEWADNLIHFKYELVHLVGRKMSGRRAQYVTADEVLEEAIRRVKEILRKSPYSEGEKEKIAKDVGVGAIRYALINVTPLKPVIFDMKKILDMKENSGPFIQYNYARACSILKKAGIVKIDPERVDYSLLTSSEEWDLIKAIGEFPIKIIDIINEMRLEILTNYMNNLAILFSKFYEKKPVLKVEDERLRLARLALVKAFQIALGNALTIAGIRPLERM
ncbi:MAG: arginine--tRNA ligase [Candidatus Baldrarchaeia archaeon]